MLRNKKYYSDNIALRGFTLAELLIALAILGVIATFTIPKILDSGSTSKYNSMAKEAAGMISGAFQSFKIQSAVTASTSPADLTPYMNYVSIYSTGSIDGRAPGCGYLQWNCASAPSVCLRLHNGAILRYQTNVSFNDTSLTSAIWFHFDPDGIVSGTNSPRDSEYFNIYPNGKLRDTANVEPNTMNSLTTVNPDPNCQASWFSWSN